MSQNKLISILAGVLLVVIITSVVVLWQAPPDGTTSSITPEGKDTPVVATQFPVDVLQRQTYQLLNKQLVREGALPVQPAASSGKANPFL